MNNGRQTLHSEHRRHDRLLVTRFAMDDAYPSERASAQSLVESCAECAALVADIRQIARSLKTLPAPARTRDFMISQAQADKMRGSSWTRFLRSLAMPGWNTLRPVAGVALSIGLVMAVVGSALPTPSPAATDTTERAGAAQVSTPPPAPQVAGSPPNALSAPPEFGGGPVAAQSSTDPDAAPGRIEQEVVPSDNPASDYLNGAYVAPTPEVKAGGAHDNATATPPSAVDDTRSLLIYAGLLVALLSVALLALAWAARRYFADPLLR